MLWDHSRLYLVMESLDRDLREHLDVSPGARDPPAVKSAMYQVLQGVAYAHAHRVIHRDLKPQVRAALRCAALRCVGSGCGGRGMVRARPPPPACAGLILGLPVPGLWPLASSGYLPRYPAPAFPLDSSLLLPPHPLPSIPLPYHHPPPPTYPEHPCRPQVGLSQGR